MSSKKILAGIGEMLAFVFAFWLVVHFNIGPRLQAFFEGTSTASAAPAEPSEHVRLAVTNTDSTPLGANPNCGMSTTLANLRPELMEDIAIDVNARAASGEVLADDTLIESSIRAGHSAIGQLNFQNVSCSEIASLAVSSNQGIIEADPKSVVPIQPVG